MGIEVRNFGDCCTTRILEGFGSGSGESYIIDRHIGEDARTYMHERLATLEKHYREFEPFEHDGLAQLVAITNSYQWMAAEVLEARGYIQSLPMVSKNHPDTLTILWHLPLQEESPR